MRTLVCVFMLAVSGLFAGRACAQQPPCAGSTVYYSQPVYPQYTYSQPSSRQPTYNQPSYIQPTYSQPNYYRLSYAQAAAPRSYATASYGTSYAAPSYARPSYSGSSYYSAPSYQSVDEYGPEFGWNPAYSESHYSGTTPQVVPGSYADYYSGGPHRG